VGRICSIFGEQEKCIQEFGWVNSGKETLEDLGIDGMMLKLISKNWNWKA